MNKSDFAVIILTHGRHDRVYTIDNLRKSGYTGEIYLLCDDEDKQLELVSDCEPSQAHSIFYASPSNMCAGCPFLDLCKARSTMPYENYLEVRNMDYRIKEETER